MSYQFNDLTVYYVGGPESPIKSKEPQPVRYEDIRAKFNKNHLFEDVDFPASLASIGKIDRDASDQLGIQQTKRYIWCRPHEVCKALYLEKPYFAVGQKQNDGTQLKLEMVSEDDVGQGELGDCWYLAALSGLTKKPEQVKVVIPDDNMDGFDDDKYCGAFHFRFYSIEKSKWVDIVVDDRLPCNNQKRPVFTSVNVTKTAEFWPALIEKAYAKFGDDQQAFDVGALEGYRGLGLLTKHAYTILDGQTIQTKDGSPPVFLVKIRNPHAQTEWKGDYSDTDELHWRHLAVDLRTKNIKGSTDINEGTFWMELNDMIKYFADIQVCMYGMNDHAFTSIISEWPLAVQNKPVMIKPTEYVEYNTFKFEVKQGTAAKERQGLVGAGKCLLAFQVVVHGYTSLYMTPKFTVTLYKVNEGDLSPGSLLTKVYKINKGVLKGIPSKGRSVNVVTAVEPGTYLMVPVLRTVVMGKDPAIPPQMQGKPIPFTVRLYTENKTELVAIPPEK